MPGYQKLNGGEALSYVRYRHTDSDIYRTGRQQLFIEALKSRLRTGTLDSSSAPKLIGDLKHNIEIAKGGGGSVDRGELESYLGLLYDLPPGHLFRNAIPLNDFNYFVTPGGADVESASPGAIAAAVHSFLHPDVRVAQAVNAQFGGQRRRPRRRRSCTSCRSRRSRCSSSTRAPSRARPRTRRYLLTRHGYSTKTLPSGDQANAPKVQQRHDRLLRPGPAEREAGRAAARAAVRLAHAVSSR